MSSGLLDTLAERDKKIEAVENVVSQYVSQMLYGCGDPQCREMLCENGRQNAIGRPTRRYTPRSARAIALTLASGPRPRSRLCAQRREGHGHVTFQREEGPRDPSATIQLLADTMQVREACEPAHSIMLKALPTSSSPQPLGTLGNIQSLQDHDEALDNAELLIRQLRTSCLEGEACELILNVLRQNFLVLMATFDPLSASAQEGCRELETLHSIIQRGQAFPANELQRWKNVSVARVLKALDNMEDPQKLRRLRHCLSLVAQLTTLVHSRRARNGRSTTPNDASLCMDVAESVAVSYWGDRYFHLEMMLEKIFLMEWPGTAVLQLGTIQLACLQLIEAMCSCILSKAPADDFDTDVCAKFWTMTAVANQVDAVEMARTWLDRSTSSEDGSCHLLEFKFLFTSAKRTEYFRTLNHLRMRQAHDNAQKAFALRSRATKGRFDVDSDVRLKYLEEHYFLLYVGRDTVLTDSFNQAWQRRSGELLRPLRVRLGEIGEFEVGHDLGGVQIEFFNLLCKQIFSEELGMFTTDAATGLSYFRPGCLQPLHMFELFGLLFGIALYNGITLPVSMSLVFYSKILGLACTDLDSIEDGWPAMYRSLNEILEEEIPGLEYAFALEANGVRLSVSSFDVEPELETTKTTAHVVEATPIVHHGHPTVAISHDLIQDLSPASTNKATSVKPGNLRWPGWFFEEALSTDEPAELTPANKTRYVQDYVTWLTYASVAAQWHHFLAGLHHILTPHHLRILSPSQLQSITEGTKHISIPDLRAATEYEGYNPTSGYISTFWSLVASWPEAKQKQLLKFVTAAERVPVGGAEKLTFKISRVSHMGAEEGLPMSSTCFGTLNLPRYESGEVLERKMTIALEMGGEGFGTG